MTIARNGRFSFPVGYQRFHRNQLFNFQLNRPYSLGYARLEDLHAAGQRIATFDTWKSEMLRLAMNAISEGRLMNAAFYYRAAEFYVFPDDPDKQPLYDRFSELFARAFEDHEIERIRISYQEAFLPAMVIRSEGNQRLRPRTRSPPPAPAR